jgi:hypothetical protein
MRPAAVALASSTGRASSSRLRPTCQQFVRLPQPLALQVDPLLLPFGVVDLTKRRIERRRALMDPDDFAGGRYGPPSRRLELLAALPGPPSGGGRVMAVGSHGHLAPPRWSRCTDRRRDQASMAVTRGQSKQWWRPALRGGQQNGTP